MTIVLGKSSKYSKLKLYEMIEKVFKRGLRPQSAVNRNLRAFLKRDSNFFFTSVKKMYYVHQKLVEIVKGTT